MGVYIQVFPRKAPLQAAIFGERSNVSEKGVGEMRQLSANQPIVITLGELEQVIRRVIRSEIKQTLESAPQTFILPEDSELYENMEEILRRKKAGTFNVLSREEALRAIG